MTRRYRPGEVQRTDIDPVALVLAFTWTLTLPDLPGLPGVTVAGFGWGPEGIWWAFSVGAFVSFLIAVAWFRRGTWKEGIEPREGPSGVAPGGARSDPDPVEDAIEDA